MSGSPFRIPYKGRLSTLIVLAEWVMGLRLLDRLYQRHFRTQKGAEFVALALRILGIEYQLQNNNAELIPEKGPVLVVANHPFGGAEGLALIDRLLKTRPDTRVLTNQMLNAIPGLQDLFIGVDILNTRTREERRAANRSAVIRATEWVAQGGVLLVFPAGEVASMNWRTFRPREQVWRHTAGRILREAEATLVPAYVDGRNSWLFYSLGLIHPLLRTVWLPRELLNKKGKPIKITFGEPEPFSRFKALNSEPALTNALRLRSLLLGSGHETHSLRDVPKSPVVPVRPAVDKSLLEGDIASLPEKSLLFSKGDLQVWCVYASAIPHVFQEIGRLRELTFREVGEGTGLETDTDKYDHHYLHLFLWNKKAREVAGAYRIGEVDKLLQQGGIKALYSRSLFRYDNRFLERLGTCLEMGRSFIRPEYQKSFQALQLLWKGVGCWVKNNPQYRVLFGPVSISNEYRELSRHLMTRSFEQHYFDDELASLVKPRTPLRQSRQQQWNRELLKGLGDIEQLSSLIRLVEKERAVPVLLRQYLKLNGTFVGFNVDPKFNDALDGLIIVDLMKSEPRALLRYMGEDGYQRLREYHEPAENNTCLTEEAVKEVV